MAKSVLDAGWSTFREQLRYKALRHGATFEIVSERLSTQTCSECGSIGGPEGIAGLRMRHWTCSDCDTSHDRDVMLRGTYYLLGRNVALLLGKSPSFRAGKMLTRLPCDVTLEPDKLRR
jgi:hypothetical protein